MEDDDVVLLNRRRTESYASEYDVATDTGGFAASQSPTAQDVPVDFNQSPMANFKEIQLKRWDLNYHEAAIFIQEGQDNEKFTSHPRSQAALPVYLITHSLWFNIIDLASAILLLSLAAIEQPSLPHFSVPIWVHGFLELFCLSIMCVELALRMKWLGPKSYLCHIRTMIKTVTLVIMFVEAIVVLVRQTNHFRVTRALRPLFLIDSDFCRGMRRFIRQVIQSMPPILDMLALLLFFMLLFSILGFYIFSSVPNDTYFQSIEVSFINLFILLTTANFPDVMMPAYQHSRWSAIFFIIYLCLELYLLMNLFLAVVTAAFSKVEKKKLKSLLLHKRAAAQYAFRLLVSIQSPNGITIRHFQGLMQYLKPKASKRDVYLLFKALNQNKTGTLSLNEFYEIYENMALSWKIKKNDVDLWSSGFRHPLNKAFKGLNWLVCWKWFSRFIYFVIFANMVVIFADAIQLSIKNSRNEDPDWESNETRYLYISVVFVTIYVLEVVLKILGLGPRRYFGSGWNIFDFIVTVTALVGVLPIVSTNFVYVVIVRPLRVLRLFKLRRSFRDVFGTLFILFHRLLSLGISLLLLYYFFGIIGMELFSKQDLRNCCINSSVESQYKYDNDTGLGGYYYLNNFDNILITGVTLFELTVVNNWYIIMEGYALTFSQWSRIYFMLFYLITMIVMTIVVAFILEAFLFRIEYRRKMDGQDMTDHAVKKVDVSLTQAELDMCEKKGPNLNKEHIVKQGDERSINGEISPTDATSPTLIWFRGEKVRSKDDFSLKMYSDEVEDWIITEEECARQRAVELQTLQHTDSEIRHRPSST